MFVAKYASDGTLLWATRAGGPDAPDAPVGAGAENGNDIATDPRGNSYVTGFFHSTTTFGAGEANETTLESTGGVDVFVAKYASDGTLLWATRAGGADTDTGLSIATDAGGNSYVTGSFQETAMFGAGEANETTLNVVSGSDLFVAKYASDGTLLWVTSASGPDTVSGSGIATDQRGNSYVTGLFRETATFGAGEANETTLESAGGTDVLVAKFDPQGTFLWATSAGGTSASPLNDAGRAIEIDLRGNSYVTGSFHGAATFGAGESNETVLQSVGAEDVFVAKFAPDGTVLWATSAGGASGNGGNGIGTDPRGNSYVAGSFLGVATFGAGEATEVVLNSVGGTRDVFVAKYAPDGTLLWATSAGGSGFDVGSGIATDPRGNSYIAGLFEGTAIFGAGEANESVRSSAGSFDVFVAKYRP